MLDWPVNDQNYSISGIPMPSAGSYRHTHYTKLLHRFWVSKVRSLGIQPHTHWTIFPSLMLYFFLCDVYDCLHLELLFTNFFSDACTLISCFYCCLDYFCCYYSPTVCIRSFLGIMDSLIVFFVHFFPWMNFILLCLLVDNFPSSICWIPLSLCFSFGLVTTD